MTDERRNHYRLLHVQPEAPLEVIRSSYRALMSKLHPDAGGDHEMAARLNVAYAVLSDPGKRSAYDQTLQKASARARHAPGHAPMPGRIREFSAGFNPLDWQASQRCPFCLMSFTVQPARELRCLRCDSPLAPAPSADRGDGEMLGRRRGTRHAREMDVRLLLPNDPRGRIVRLRDLSFSGLSLLSAERIAAGSVLRVVAQGFDTVAATVACRASPSARGACSVHARLLTLELVKRQTGVYVNATA